MLAPPHQRNHAEVSVDVSREPHAALGAMHQDRRSTHRSGNAASGKGYQPALTAIFFSCARASCVFGRVTVRTPFLKLASILPVSTP